MKILSEITDQDMFFLLAGPCVIEGEEMALHIAERVSELTDRLGIPYVFKGSFKKANRSRLDSFTGIGDEKALKVLAKVKRDFQIPVVTDVHSVEDVVMAAEYVDILQIPAFLCRQTDLLVAAAHTGRMVNIKKGQFLSPEAMRFAVDKIRESGSDNVMVTERGTTFGYQDLVVDYRGIRIMQENCKCPVIVDATHSLQQPNQACGVTGGTTATDRNDCQGGNRSRSGRAFHRNASRTGKCKVGRCEYAATRFIGGTARKAGARAESHSVNCTRKAFLT